MRIAIYGVGAIGGYLGARLAASGAQISLIARGRQLEAISSRGLTLLEADQPPLLIYPPASADPADFGVQDAVFLTVKSHALPGVLDGLSHLVGEQTMIIPAINGIPWWYFQNYSGPFGGRVLQSVDPGGVLSRSIDPARIIGCVVYPGAEVVAPGIVQHTSGDRLELGELDGRRSQRLKELADILAPAGIKPRIREHIRDDIWLKLWGNAAFNPLSALTGAGVGEIAGHPETRPIVIAIMQEVAQVAGALGVNFSVDLETRIAWTEALGAHKTSMLQDLEAGRSLETDALGTVIQELAGLLGINTPNLNLILALLRRRAAHPLLTPSG